VPKSSVSNCRERSKKLSQAIPRKYTRCKTIHVVLLAKVLHPGVVQDLSPAGLIGVEARQ